MGDQNAKSYLIGIKFDTRRFIGSLIMNPSSTFRDSEWWVPYGGSKYSKLLDWDEVWYSGVFEVVIY